jgi:hypothetical protein
VIKEHSENYYLQTASDLVSKGAMDSAIQLLVDASGEFPGSTRIINVLGKLYLKTNRPKEAAACFEKSLKINTIDDVPTEADFSYLSEQAESLTESEYSYDEPAEYIPCQEIRNNKKLSLRRDEGYSESKIPKVKKVLVKSSIGLIEENSAVEQSIDESDLKDTNLQAVTSQEPEPELQLPIFETEIDDDLDGDWLDDLEVIDAQIIEDEETDLIERNVEDTELFDANVETDVDVDDEIGIYDFWDDAEDLEGEADYTAAEELGALADELTIEDRARQVAISFVDRVGWHKSDIDFITDIFIENGWGQARVALEREVNIGLTREELELAFYIKCLWKECDRYWISFPRMGSVKESTDATFKNCSWKQVLRLVRIFPDIPVVEEITEFLESEFEYWYADRQLRYRFRSYSDYLFKYRLNDSIYTISISAPWRFESALESDELTSDCFTFSHSDEMVFLRNNGIDVLGRHAPNNSYVTDNQFDYYQLDLEE